MIRAGFKTPDAKTLEEMAERVTRENGYCLNCGLPFKSDEIRVVFPGFQFAQACLDSADCRLRQWEKRECEHGNKADDCPHCKEIELQEMEGDIVGEVMYIVNNTEAPKEVVVEALAFALRHFCEENKIFPKCVSEHCEARETFGHSNEISWECDDCHKIANICPGPHT